MSDLGDRLANTSSQSNWRLFSAIWCLGIIVIILLLAGIRANQISCYRTRDSRATSLLVYKELHPNLRVPKALAAEQITCNGLFPQAH